MNIRFATPSDVNIYEYLMGQGFSGNWHADRFKWQYLGPASRSVLFVAEEGNEPAGMLGIELRRFSNGGLGAAVIDMVVASGWRRKGVLRALEDVASRYAREAAATVMTSLPNQLGTVALERLQGWSIVCEIPVLRRPCSAPFPPGFVSSTIAPASGITVGILRDEEYRTWRYGQHPHYCYRTICGSRGKNAVAKLFGSSSVVGDIVEVFGPDGGLDAMEDIYRLAAEQMAIAGAHEVVTWGVLPADEHELLLCLGWVAVPQARHLAVKALSPVAEFLYLRESWRIQPADIEHY